MEVQFIAGIAPVSGDPAASRRFYVDTLGLALRAVGSDGGAHAVAGGADHRGLHAPSRHG